MKLVQALQKMGIILEMNDWKTHFTNGTKGQPKTNIEVLDYVENLIKNVETDEQKIKNHKLAPWLVKIVLDLDKTNDINEEDLNKINIILQWFKKTGSEGNIPHLTLDQAFEKVEKSIKKAQEKELSKQQKEEPNTEEPHLEAEKNGDIKRIYSVGDGSGRAWFEIINNIFLTEESELNSELHWGVECQARDFLGTNEQNFLLMGPPKGNKGGPWSTQIGIGGFKDKKNAREIRQEGNQIVGRQSTSAGYSDGAERLVDFLCFCKTAREKIKYFATYGGEIPTGSNGSSVGGGGYGAEKTLHFLINSKPELFNKLCDYRDDIIETNKEYIIFLKGLEWFLERFRVDLEKTSKENPEKFLSNFSEYINRFGKEAIDALKNIDLIAFYKLNPHLILINLNNFILNIPKSDFENLTKNINLDDYMQKYPEEFKKLFKAMSNSKDYKELFKDILDNHAKTLLNLFGSKVNSIFEFLKFVSSPKLPAHQNAIYDVQTGNYIGKRVNVENINGQRTEIEEQFIIEDNLKVLNQKERKDFIKKNKDLIKSFSKGDENDKEILYLTIYFSELSAQEAETSPEKDFLIKYHDEKFNQYYKDVSSLQDGKITQNDFVKKYGAKVDGNYMFDVNGNVILKKYNPGIIELIKSLQKKDSNKNILPILEDKKFLPPIFNYFKFNSKETIPFLRDIDGLVGYLSLLKKNGMSNEKIIELKNTFLKSKEANFNKPSFISYLAKKMFNFLDYEYVWKEIQNLKPLFYKLGNDGTMGLKSLFDALGTTKYLVKPGETIMFKGNEGYKKEYSLTSGRKYRVINVKDAETSDHDIFQLSYETEEDSNEGLEILNAKNNKIINGFVLVSDDNGPDGHGQHVWVPSYRFSIRKEKYLPISLYENMYFENTLNKIENRFSKLKSVLNESVGEKPINTTNPRYTAIWLDPKSHEYLKNLIEDLKEQGIIKDDWEVTADHVTINMGPIYDKTLLGKIITIQVIGIGYDEKIAALQVKVNYDILFKNKIPHITLAFDSKSGAKPKMSNELTNWVSIVPFKLSGIVKEVF